jgi:two-component system cell cycle response regulator CtrA
MHILQVGLDTKTAQFLVANRCTLHEAEDVEEASDLVEWMRDNRHDALLFNLNAKVWGPYVARVFRKEGLDTPIVGIAAQGETKWGDLRATFLENGGDDLIRHPANPRELLASLRAVSRRFKGSFTDVYTHTHGQCTLKFDRTVGRVQVNGKEVFLTGQEAKIIEILCVGAPRTQSKEMIMQNLYSLVDDEPEIKIIDVFVCKLRKKLGAYHPDAEGFIETVWGRGYRITEAA